MHVRKVALAALAVAAVGLLGSCGLLTAPVSVPAAVAQNATINFKGRLVDPRGQTLDGVLVVLQNTHHIWTPIAGAKDLDKGFTRRADQTFEFEARGSAMEFTFSKDGYQSEYYRFNAEHPNDVVTRHGTWPNREGFAVLLLPARTSDAPLARYAQDISYEAYPIVDCVALNNVATDGKTGDLTYHGKDAEDPTVYPPGTLYLTMQKGAPPALDAKGNIDPNDLGVPDCVTLKIGGSRSGFIRIEPRLGIPPLAAADTAPESGYVRELVIWRSRLKEMRLANPDRVIEPYEYFYFRAGDRYGKGRFSWANRSGKPAFRYELYVQQEVGDRNLTRHGTAMAACRPGQ